MKRIISLVLALLMLSTMSTVAVASADSVEASPSIVNGKFFSVGDKLRVTYYASSDSDWVNFQGFVTYDKMGLMLEDFSMPNTNTGVMYNTEIPGTIYYSGSSISNPYDFTTEKVFFTASFTVTGNGEYNIENNWEIISDTNYDAIVDDCVIVDESRLSCRLEVVPTLTQESTTEVTTEYTTTTIRRDTVPETTEPPKDTIPSEITETKNNTLSPTTATGTKATVTEETKPDSETTFNGLPVNVGDKVTVNYYVNSDEKWEDFQGYVTYDSAGVKLDKFTMPNTQTGVMYKTANLGYIRYNGTSYADPYDFTTEKVFLSAEFTVLKEGNYNVENIWQRIDDINSKIIVLESSGIYDNNRITCRYETLVNSEGTVPEETTNNTVAPTTTTEPSEPLLGETTFNGKKVKVGDLVTVTYYIQTEKMCEDFQVYMEYGTNSVHNDGIELVSFTPGETKGVMYNTDIFGKIYYNGSSFMNPYDFTEKTALMTATFRIVKEGGQYYSSGNVDVLTGIDGTKYATDGKMETPFTWIESTDGAEVTYPTTLPTTTIETSTVADTTVSETTIAPTTATEPSEPLLGETTFNGKKVKVGDLVTVTYYIQTDKMCEDFQVYMEYGTTSVNYDGIELVSFTPGQTKGAMYNTDIFGKIYYNGSSFMNPYDFTEKTALMTATFRIVK
ncbi:MAG: hypothetical protein MSH11_04255, partial [Ruminococcus sp.]|nr:hypothetical protein [Ruminococcus sp.]